jgi:hypothetical protein
MNSTCLASIYYTLTAPHVFFMQRNTDTFHLRLNSFAPVNKFQREAAFTLTVFAGAASAFVTAHVV